MHPADAEFFWVGLIIHRVSSDSEATHAAGELPSLYSASFHFLLAVSPKVSGC